MPSIKEYKTSNATPATIAIALLSPSNFVFGIVGDLVGPVDASVTCWSTFNVVYLLKILLVEMNC